MKPTPARRLGKGCPERQESRSGWGTKRPSAILKNDDGRTD